MRIKYQEKEVFETETFLSPGCEVEVYIGNGNNSLKLILEFVDSDENEHNFQLVPIDNKSLRVILKNWNNPLGTSFIEPIEIGTLSHRKLYILLLVRKVGSQGDVREITLSSYIGEEVQNGED